MLWCNQNQQTSWKLRACLAIECFSIYCRIFHFIRDTAKQVLLQLTSLICRCPSHYRVSTIAEKSKKNTFWNMRNSFWKIHFGVIQSERPDFFHNTVSFQKKINFWHLSNRSLYSVKYCNSPRYIILRIIFDIIIATSWYTISVASRFI